MGGKKRGEGNSVFYHALYREGKKFEKGKKSKRSFSSFILTSAGKKDWEGGKGEGGIRGGQSPDSRRLYRKREGKGGKKKGGKERKKKKPVRLLYGRYSMGKEYRGGKKKEGGGIGPLTLVAIPKERGERLGKGEERKEKGAYMLIALF